ncbi:MAG: phospholipase D family protein [Halioglobus sp.]
MGGNQFRLYALLVATLLSSCSTLPEAPAVEPESASVASAIGDLADIATDIKPDQSSFHLLPKAVDAMNWRLALLDSAESSIDIQYFIWKDDASGSLMLEHLFAAADRGVKVRMIIDDMFLSSSGAFSGADKALAAIAYHPNIQLRLFNPGKFRDGIAGLAGNFGGSLYEYNRRMHNKVMIFDGHFAVVGGRNIGDEYFGLHQPYNFLDLDMLVTGDVVADAAAAFRDYWNADLVYPASALKEMDEAGYRSMRKENSNFVDEQTLRLAAFTAEQHDTDAYLSVLYTQMRPGFAVFLQDDPVKRGGREFRLYDILNEMVQPGSRELVVTSPYFIPVGNILETLAEDIATGVEVRVITNSLASNDAVPAHSHYQKYRKDILATGTQLYEFHHQPSGDLRPYSDVDVPDNNGVALHAKAFSVDGERCYVGSLNFDPRSIELNTENGIYVESEALCGELQEMLKSLTELENAWSVSIDGDGRLNWTSYEGTIQSQPALGAGQRLSGSFFRILPLESQL